MVKAWKDANEVIKMVNELPSKKLRKVEKEMISIPKFDKNIDKKEGKPRIKQNYIFNTIIMEVK